MKRDELVQMYLTEMARHTLAVLCDTEKVKCYRCGRPDSGNYSFYVTFTPAGICIQGDITPERNGSTSCRGYNVEWFSGKLSASYLAEKFLQTKFRADVAKEQLSDPTHWVNDDASDEQKESIRRIAEGLDDYGDNGASWLYEQLLDIGIQCDDGCPGWGYCPTETATLVAIQTKFAELYQKLAPEVSPCSK